MKKTIMAILLTAAAFLSPTAAFASGLSSIPENNFGTQNNAIHFNPNMPTGNTSSVGLPHTDAPIHFNPEVTARYGTSNVAMLNAHSGAGHSGFAEGAHIGSLTIHSLNRSIRVFEGETMRNMDFGAGRFAFSGMNSGNTALIGHNRGRSNGFFSFVRNLQPGDLITLEMGGTTRTYTVSHEIIVHETDVSALTQFGDTRLSLVTCLEYRPRYRRIAIAFEV